MRDYTDPPRWRLAAGLRSGLPHPDAIGLAWLWVYLGVWVLFALWMAAVHPDFSPAFTYPRLVRYAELWLGDHGGAATLQLSVMVVQVLMVVYLWLRFRGLRHHRRIALGRYLVLAGLALLLLGLQQVLPRLLRPRRAAPAAVAADRGRAGPGSHAGNPVAESHRSRYRVQRLRDLLRRVAVRTAERCPSRIGRHRRSTAVSAVAAFAAAANRPAGNSWPSPPRGSAPPPASG